MTSTDLPDDLRMAVEERSASRYALVLAVYTAAIFVSALLLFSVQPLFAKMVLPRLGGSPAVWSVAMVFFQSLLLAGYAYAHFLTRIKSRAVPVGGASCASGGRVLHAAAVDREWVGRTSDQRLRALAARPFRGLDRPAVLCAGGEQPAAAGLRPAPVTPRVAIPTFCMLLPTSAVSWRCCPIRCCWSRCSRCICRT